MTWHTQPSCWSTHHVLPPGSIGGLGCRGNEEFAKHVATHHDAHATTEVGRFENAAVLEGVDFENVCLKRVEVLKDKKFWKLIIEEKTWKFWTGSGGESSKFHRCCFFYFVGSW